MNLNDYYTKDEVIKLVQTESGDLDGGAVDASD